MTHEAAKAQEYAELYVNGRLGGPESEAFEEHFFACAECWDDVELQRKMRAGVRAAPVLVEQPAYWKWAFAAAACALVGFVSWALLVQIPRLERDLAAARNTPPVRVEVPAVLVAQANLPVLMLEASRADGANVLKVPAGAKEVAVWLDAPPAAAKPFRLEMAGQTLGGLEPNAHGALTAAVPAEKLPPGAYTARLFGANGALAGEYKFEVRR